MQISLNLDKVKAQSDIVKQQVLSDDALVLGLRLSERSAQEAFYKNYFGKMFPTAMRYTSTKEDAYDIINTAFLKVITTIENYKDDNFPGWVKTIVVRTAIDYGKKYKYNKPVVAEIIEVDTPVYNKAISNLRIEELLELIQRIPDSSRTVFNMFVLDGLSHQEIADSLSISKGTSKWHVANARKYLLKLTTDQHNI
jgi:RNA polymerase sigma-70 factor (ECF subfamily)